MRNQMLEAEFPYGVLLITDAESTEEIPSWESAEEQVAVAANGSEPSPDIVQKAIEIDRQFGHLMVFPE